MNFAPSTIWTGDNFYIMRGMDSAMVNLIYLDTSIRVSHEGVKVWVFLWFQGHDIAFSFRPPIEVEQNTVEALSRVHGA